MTCWVGWYTVYWAKASPTLDTSKERTGRIYMAGKGAREILEMSAQRWRAAVVQKQKLFHYNMAKYCNTLITASCQRDIV
jgi:hypothetical protein